MKVTERNTKKEIIDELRSTNQLLKEAQKQLTDEKKRFATPSTELKITKNASTVKKAVDLNPDSIREERLKITEFYSSIENQARGVKEQLDLLQEAKAILEKELDELHDIKSEADTLEALVRANAIEKEKYHEEKKSLEKSWTNKIQHMEDAYLEKQDDLEKSRQRKKEEYKYQFNKHIMMEEDAWEQETTERKRKLDKEENEIREKLKKAADELTAKHAEFNDYKTQVEAFPEKLAQAVEEAKTKAVKRLEQSHHFKTEHLKKDNEIKTSLLEQKVADLTARVEDLTKRNSDLTNRLDSASEKVENIAREAISGASKQKVVLNTTSDKEK